ncbi:hypothetical protein D0T53_09210 [Dysgonomonas sp. 216]|uniref:hypothetical protein n=1 Tax=Dysgonomonas sp. 216 TaxID=2302934 RepID=UPI0013D4AC66|nr:hypothetical protein [Dysgonomonas sp. 216]NDW19090.1 hypothetical protein [Dysgonomonas sp. 216]
MTHIELYIDRKLCDIQSPEKLGIRLNRVLINPSELNTKDAQYSYSITLPSTVQNDKIFGYSIVEEVKNKFNINYEALLIVNDITVFEGIFTLSEITPEHYKGNLVVPAKKTVKDIFGDKKMTELGKWEIPFSDFIESMNKYNFDNGIPECIFPLVLYGLLPKVPSDPVKGSYTNKDVFDDTVRLGIQDFPPSINCLKAIEYLFGTKGYSIEGNVFDDERLANLYMSYKNPVDYQQEWNWAHLGKVNIKGNWTNYHPDKFTQFETLSYRNDFDGAIRYITDIFNSSMADINVTDNGTNVMVSNTEEKKNDSDTILKSRKHSVHYTVPVSGLYKIELKSSIRLKTEYTTRNYKGRNYVPSTTEKLDSRHYEIKLLRDFGEGDFGFSEQNFDTRCFRENLPQDENKKNEQLQYFPVPSPQAVMMIDPKVNERLISGLSFGGNRIKANPLYKGENKHLGLIMAIKHGWSWDVEFSQKDKIYSAINSPAYSYIDNRPKDEDGSDEETISDIDVNKFKVKLESKKGGEHFINYTNIEENLTSADGQLFQVVWLNKGEHLTLIAISDKITSLSAGSSYVTTHRGWPMQDIEFDLTITPFKKKEDWITVDKKEEENKDEDSESMNWDDTPDFDSESLDLSKFLPSEDKVDEWLDGFCKTFNLQIEQSGDTNFALNHKQNWQDSPTTIVDISDRASIRHRTNLPLGLPAAFELNFKINEEEEGFERTKENGNGRFDTGTLNGSTITQSSTFSYNWFKEIKRDGINLYFPVITNKEIWEGSDHTSTYSDLVKKLYTNYTQRFWYRNTESGDIGLMYDKLGQIWNTPPNPMNDGVRAMDFYVPRLSNSYKGYLDTRALRLDYKDEGDSIMRSYFNIVAPNASNYTEVECFLAPDEYELLNGGTFVRFNGDLYHVGAIEGYDPLYINKCKLRLIRKAY